MTADANPVGDMFGGWLLWQMNLAAGSAAHHAQGRCATMAIDKIAFLFPLRVDDEVTAALFTFVALDKDGRPREVRPLVR